MLHEMENNLDKVSINLSMTSGFQRLTGIVVTALLSYVHSPLDVLCIHVFVVFALIARPWSLDIDSV